VVGHAGSPTRTVCWFDLDPIQGQGHGAFELPTIAHNCTFPTISSATFAWSSKLIVGSDSMGPDLQLVRARFSNFFLRMLPREFKLRGMSIFHEIQMTTAWGYSQIVGHAGSTTGIVHANVTLTQSQVKVKVGVLNFRKLVKPCNACMLAAMTASPLRGFLVCVSVWLYTMHFILIQSLAYCFSDSEDCYILLALFYLFSPTDFFLRPWTNFWEPLLHDAVCSAVDYVVFYVSPKKFEGWKPLVLPICGPKVNNLSPTIP